MKNQETLLRVNGMTCSSCVRHVTHALEAIAGVTRAKVHLATGEATIEHDGAVPGDALVTAVVEAGYEATRASPENTA